MLWRSSNARIYAVHLTTANQSEIRRAYLVSVRATRKMHDIFRKCHGITVKKILFDFLKRDKYNKALNE